jgi:hypothetical protein
LAGVSFAAGEVGQCFSFTADGDAVTIPHDAALNGTRKEVLLPANTPAQRFFRLAQ